MARTITPLHERDVRMPEAGRIRIGVKTGNAMKSIDTFRFTAIARDNIDQLAALYGGDVVPMNDPKSQHKWQVITPTNSISIYLPREAFSTWYELWEGSGRVRQCDGVTATISTREGYEPTPCPCHASNKMLCRPVSRLNVIIPDISFAGVWRLETKGWNAMAELPGMIDIVQALNDQGQLVRATLSVQKRTQTTPAGKKNFVVPTISLPFTPEQALTGQGSVAAITTGPTLPALNSGDLSTVQATPVSVRATEDDIIDAEIIEDDPLRERFEDMCLERHLDFNRLWPAVCKQVDNDPARIEACIAKVESGALSFMGFNPDGTVIWRT